MSDQRLLKHVERVILKLFQDLSTLLMLKEKLHSKGAR
jgi:hypothetical protein